MKRSEFNKISFRLGMMVKANTVTYKNDGMGNSIPSQIIKDLMISSVNFTVKNISGIDKDGIKHNVPLENIISVEVVENQSVKDYISEVMDYMLAMEILIPVNDLFDENGGHITKKKYGINLLNRAAIQIKEVFCKGIV